MSCMIYFGELIGLGELVSGALSHEGIELWCRLEGVGIVVCGV